MDSGKVERWYCKVVGEDRQIARREQRRAGVQELSR